MFNKKWLVRVGALLILLGFVLPSLTVSCSALPAPPTTYSLLELATQADIGSLVLFLVPLGVLITLIFAFLPERARLKTPLLFFGQASGAMLGILGILVAMFISFNDTGKHGFDITPKFGINILATGYALVAVGLVFQLPELETTRETPEKSFQEAQATVQYSPYPGAMQNGQYYEAPGAALPQQNQAGQYYAPTAAAPFSATPSPEREFLPGEAWLQVLRGNLPTPYIQLNLDDFAIGRGSKNHLQLSDQSVSRSHARLRYAQGSWFIQDQNSAGGIYVNGTPVKATRLKPGDKIEIGEYLFEFRI